METLPKQFIENHIGTVMDTVFLEQQGCTSTVYKISALHGTYIFKSAETEIFRKWLEDEAEVLKKLNEQTDIPVPRFHGFTRTDNESHLLMSYEEGVTLTEALAETDSQDVKNDLIESFGTLLYKLHTTDTSIFKISSREKWLDIQLKKAAEYLRAGNTDGDQDLLDDLNNKKPHDIKNTIIHGDCTTDNVLVKNNQVYLFIDTGGMTYGDPRYDIALAVSDFLNHPDELSSFYRGYQRYKIDAYEFKYFDSLYEFF